MQSQMQERRLKFYLIHFTEILSNSFYLDIYSIFCKIYKVIFLTGIGEKCIYEFFKYYG